MVDSKFVYLLPLDVYKRQELMGVYDQSLVEPLAQVMANLGVNRGMVVYGQDSLDEISMCARCV